MAKDPAFLLRQKYLPIIEKKWELNNHSLNEISCVYAMVSIDMIAHSRDIVYVGSTTKLFSRYRSHKIPSKIKESGNINLMYYIPMNKGFYDYEMKLIKKLQPIFNKQHK